MNLHQWAIKWSIPFEAVQDLMNQMGQVDLNPIKEKDGQSEAAVQTRCRLKAQKTGNILWRNNVGVLKNQDGVPIRYGLANDSKGVNKKIKSSDLIGIRRVLITPEMVGTIIGQFFARETKHELWSYSGTDEEQAQLKYLEIVLSFGGDAGFATDERSI